MSTDAQIATAITSEDVTARAFPEGSEIDLTSPSATNAVLFLNDQSATGAYAGIAVTNPENSNEAQKERRREKAETFHRILSDQYWARERAKMDEKAKQAAESISRIRTLIDQYLTGENKELAHKYIDHQEQQFLQIQTEFNVTVDRIDQQTNDLFGRINGLEDGAEATLRSLFASGKELITVELSLPGHEDEGTARRYAVFKDETRTGDEQYYAIDPDKPGERYYLSDHPDSQQVKTALRDIQSQEAKGELFGNGNEPKVDQYNTAYAEWLELCDKHGLREQRTQIVKSFRKLMELEGKATELNERMDSIIEKISNLEEKLEKGLLTQADYDDMRAELEEDRITLVSDIKSFQTAQNTAIATLEQEIAKLENAKREKEAERTVAADHVHVAQDELIRSIQLFSDKEYVLHGINTLKGIEENTVVINLNVEEDVLGQGRYIVNQDENGELYINITTAGPNSDNRENLSDGRATVISEANTRFYLKNHENFSSIQVLIDAQKSKSFGNDLPASDVEDYFRSSKYLLLSHLNGERLDEYRELQRKFNELGIAQAKLELIERQIAELERQIEDLKNGKLDPADIDTDLKALEQQLVSLNNDRREQRIDVRDRSEDFEQRLAALEEKQQQEVSEAKTAGQEFDEVMSKSVEVTEVMMHFSSRHEFLRAIYGHNAAHANTEDLQGIFSEQQIDVIRGLELPEDISQSETPISAINPETGELDMVYRSNELNDDGTHTYYFFDLEQYTEGVKNSGMLTIDNPTTIASLELSATVQAQRFANEINLVSQDPNNTFFDTLQAETLDKKHTMNTLRKVTKKTGDAFDEERADAEQATEEVNAARVEEGLEAVQATSLKAEFLTASEMEEALAETVEDAKEFADSVTSSVTDLFKINMPSILGGDKKEETPDLTTQTAENTALPSVTNTTNSTL